MSLTGIDAALDRALQQVSSDERVQRDAKAAFLEVFERYMREGGFAQLAASVARNHDTSATGGIGTQPFDPRATFGATAASGSLLKNPGLEPLAQLPDDLTAESPLYNEREAMLRERLNLPELERRLMSMADSYGVEYSVTDLEGILRNAGYGAAHLGSSDRYMAAIEKFIGEAENNYRQRSSNVPGSDA